MVCPVCVATALAANAPAIAAAFGGAAAVKMALQRRQLVCQRAPVPVESEHASSDRPARVSAPRRPDIRRAPIDPMKVHGYWQEDDL